MEESTTRHKEKGKIVGENPEKHKIRPCIDKIAKIPPRGIQNLVGNMANYQIDFLPKKQ
jgi:hypothetical protein